MTPRTISQIQQQIIDAKNADATLSSLNSTSQVANWLLWSYIQAVAISLLENVLVIFQGEVEADVVLAAPSTPQWIKDRVLRFQWSDSVPQVVQYLSDNSLDYPTVNPALRIVTQVAVLTTLNKVVLVKCTADGVPLTVDQQAAMKSYLDYLEPSGIQVKILSVDPDFLLCGASVYYDGQYSAVIKSTVEAAVNTYLANIPFNGYLTLSELEDKIQAVPGVKDVVLTMVEIRPYNVVAADASKMVTDSQILLRTVGTYSGRAIADTDSGRTLADTITYTPQ